MKHFKSQIKWIIFLLLFSDRVFAAANSVGNPVEVRASNAATEQYERDVDQAAQASQENAIFKLSSLLKKYHDTTQAPILIAKLADLEQENAAILFRIAHGIAQHKNKPLDLTRYRRAMDQSIASYTTLINRFPDYVEITHAYFMRGKSYEELENTPAATHDYLKVISHFPVTEETLTAYMSLADFSITANDHPQAILYLKEVEKHPEDSHYPFALYKLAWSYYNLKDIPASLSYAEKDVNYYNAIEAASKENPSQIVASSDNALKENALLDMPVFYFEGYEQNLPQYSLSSALPYFKKQDQSPILGRMLLRFAKLLRAHSHETDLIAWKDQLLQTEPDRPETLEVLIATYEYQQNKRYFPQMIESAHDLAKIYAKHPAFEGIPKAQKMLLDTAEILQASISKNKTADDVKDYSNYLASIYASFAQMVSDKDPRIPRVHYNLAETLFEVKDYAKATENYRWIIDHLGWKAKLPKSTSSKDPDFTIADASLKAIASRYETLRLKQLIPTQLQAKAMDKDPEKPMDESLSEWIGWIAEHRKQVAVQKGDDGLGTFAFEANRAIYNLGYINLAVGRMVEFAKLQPASSYAIPSASLVLDTYIATQNWEKTLELANSFLEIKEWKNNEFTLRVTAVASDSSYKLAESQFKNKDYKGTLARADDFLKRYPASVRVGDTLSLAGNAAVLAGEKDKALAYYSRLIKDLPPSDNSAKAILARAEIYEERYALTESAADYRTYLALPINLQEKDPKVLDNMKRKILIFSWVSGDQADLKAELASKQICAGQDEKSDLFHDCEKYQTLASDTNPESAFDQARKATGQNRTILSLIALKDAKSLAFRDRLLMARFVAEGWEDLDPLLKFSMTPTLVDVIPRTFSLNRMSMSDVAPLRAQERYIAHRVDMIHEMENTATKVMKLPWARLKAEVLNEVGGLYLDLSHGLSAIPAPKNMTASDLTTYEDTIRKLTVPFEDKGTDMRSKAFEIASRASVDSSSYQSISEAFFTENPSQAKALRADLPTDKPRELGSEILKDWDTAGDWGKTSSANPTLSSRLQEKWLQAIGSQHWAMAGYLLQAAQDRKLLTAPTLALMKVVYLNAIGARAEALAQLEEAAPTLAPEAKRSVLATLIQYSFSTHSKAHAQALLKDYIATWPDKTNEELIADVEKSAEAQKRAPAVAPSAKPSAKPAAPQITAMKKIPSDQVQWIEAANTWASSK